ncbi:MAG: hypothetical protein IKT98_01815 [Selenomonadaceae bacterium]|nr:hypothetical protein [Selenomonadaceae bacterium]
MQIVIMKLPYIDSSFCVKLSEVAERLGYDIAGIVSLDLEEKLTSIKNYHVYPLNEILNLKWDVAVFACDDGIFDDIVPRMVELGIGKREQLQKSFWLLQQLMIKKYEDFDDPAIQETLEYWKTHELSVFNQHVQMGTGDRVFFDSECDLPYVYFKTVDGDYRKMYYPRNYQFSLRNGEKFVRNLMTEQLPTSPHLYIKDDHKICAGDIVIDAGVCEGNFALRYIDLCSKMYLFEADSKWIEPLNQTFKDYRDKVEIIPRFVSNVTGGENITIDDALPNLRGEKIFIKMDIEGAEPLALRGAKRILTNNFVKASICSYHKEYDLIKIKSIMQSYGYKTSTSNGWMVFIWDPHIWDTADFRKGIVYAKNY